MAVAGLTRYDTLVSVRATAMKKRSQVGSKQATARPRKASKPMGRGAPKAVTRRGSAPADPTEVARLTRERDAALEQQTATSEVLHVISTSRGELEPVFHIMLERAVRICEAKFGALYRFDGNALLLAAQVGASREIAQFRASRGPFQPTPHGLLPTCLTPRRLSRRSARQWPQLTAVTTNNVLGSRKVP